MHRWRDIALYGVLGALAWRAIIDLPITFLQLSPENAATIRSEYLFVLIITLLTLVIFWVGFRFTHIRSIISYPSVLLSIPLALLLAHLLPPIKYAQNESISVMIGAIILYGFSAILAATIRLIEVSPQKEKASAPEADALPSIFQWLDREEPINLARNDLFQRGAAVRRIEEVLSHRNKTIAVIGEFGAGKSSLIRLLVQKFSARAQNNIWIVPVSCWGFENSSVAQEAILRQVIDSLESEVDCLPIRKLPEDYVSAISEASPWARLFLPFLRRDLDPMICLQKLSEVLRAVDGTLVIALEDCDRNGKEFHIFDIESLLQRLRTLDHVSFIVTASADAQVDFAKLCDFTELIPQLRPLETLSCVDEVRGHALSCYSDDVDPIAEERDPLLSSPSANPLIEVFHAGIPKWEWALAELISNPRILKGTLRRFWASWQILHGEVDIDELLVMSALREAAKPAYRFILRNKAKMRLLRERLSSDRSEERERERLISLLEKEWSQVAVMIPNKVRSAATLVQSIFIPESRVFDDVTNPGSSLKSEQSIREQFGTDYLDRVVNEHFSLNEAKDQLILRGIINLNKDPNAVADVAGYITASQANSDLIQKFRRMLHEERIPLLASEIFSRYREQFGNRACHDLNGFTVICSLLRDARVDEKWMANELAACFPKNIRLAVDIFYRLIDDNPGIDVEKCRSLLVQLCQRSFSKVEPPSLTDGLQADYPYTLNHLIKDCRRNSNPPFSHSLPRDWAWLSDHLMFCVRTAANVILPQLAVVFDKRTGNPDASDIEIDGDALAEMFGNRARELLSAMTQPVALATSFPDQYRKQMTLLPVRARECLDRLEK